MDLEIPGPITKTSEKFDFKELKKSIITAFIFLAIVFLLYAKNQGYLENVQITPSVKPNIHEEEPLPNEDVQEVTPSSGPDINEDENVCKTKQCEILGKRMKSMMNPKIDPCDDFFESICGNYPENLNDEIVQNQIDDYNDLSKFIKTYQPITRSEKIAMNVLEKCMDKSEDRTRYDPIFWENLRNHSLTDVLIEAAKTNPIETGFLKNHVNLAHNSTINSKYLFLLIAQGLEKNSEMQKFYEQIQEESPKSKKTLMVSVESAKDYVKFIDLEKYVKSLLPEEYRELKNDGEYLVSLNEMIILDAIVKTYGVDYVKHVIREKYSSTLGNYLVDPEYNNCFEKLTKLFPGTLATIFVKHFVGTKNLNKANKLFRELQSVSIEMMDENDWLDEELKEILRQEVFNIKHSIGIPDEYKNQKNIDKMYSRIGDFENQSYLELIQNLLKMNSEETFLRVSRREEVTYYGKPISVSANYFGSSHRTSIAPIFLNFPYLDENLPDWTYFASIGFIVGHEIGHAFDASDFYKNPMRNDIEMSTKMKQIFKDRIDCIIQKYNKFQFEDGTFSNGTHTQKEDSADMIGSNLAYRLFKQLKLKNTKKLPYLQDYTIEQQFFQRLGNTWCSGDFQKKYLEHRKKDSHSSLKFRVNGMMSNSEEFAKAYNCPKNSPMNPEKKCPLFK